MPMIMCPMSFAALAMAICLASAPSAAEDDFLTDAKGIPVSIHKVAAGGYWSEAEAEGFFRVVVVAAGVEHVVHRLYIQWLAIDADTQGYHLVRTVGVEEVNGGHGATLDVEAAFPDLDRLEVSIKVNPRGGGPAQSLVLSAGGDGTYTIGPEAALATAVSMVCENPRRAYVATFDEAARTFAVETKAGATNYEVDAVDEIDGVPVVRGKTIDDGPAFVAYLAGNPRIEFIAGDELIQVDACRPLP